MISFSYYLQEVIRHDDLFPSENIPKINDSDYLKQEHDYSFNPRHASGIHDEPDIFPQNITKEHEKSINDYTYDSSTVNNHLDNLHKGKFTKDDYIHGVNNRLKARKLSDVFTSENTIKKPLITYSGIPTFIGNKLLKSESNSKHTFGRFTSTTTSLKQATNYARDHASSDSTPLHILKCYNEPGSALSLANHSKYKFENEVLLKNGAHATYHYTTVEKIPYQYKIPSKKEQSFDDKYVKYRKAYIHHITIHPTHTPIEQYPGYDKL